MGSGAASEFSLPSGVQIALAAVGVVSFLLTLAGFIFTVRLSPRKVNEAPRRGRALHPIRFWRPSQYSLALGHLEDFCSKLREDVYYKGEERGHVTESDLVRWITQLSLTCASQMVPQSLGKANLFRVSQITKDDEGRRAEIRLYSSEFVGVFSVNQLTNMLNAAELRRLYANEGQRTDEYPAALQCLVEGAPTIQSLRKRHAVFDEPEKSLGATHILGIPLFKGMYAISERDQAVSITVDLKYSRFGGWLLDRRDLTKTSLFRRAMHLKEAIAEIPQLRDPRFMPLGDRSALLRELSRIEESHS